MQPTGKRVTRTSEDQLAFTGTLKSGAVVSFHLRSGLSAAKPGRVPFEWLIDGEDGSIRLAGDSSFYHVMHPKTVLIKGEAWEPSEKPVDVVGNVAAAWDEIAKGSAGKYSTFDDALRVKKVIAAIRKSAREGVRVDIV